MSSIGHWIGELAPIVGVAAGVVALTVGFAAAVTRTLHVLDPDPGAEPEWWPEFERQLTEYMTSRGVGSLQQPDHRKDDRVS
jgi:hypothetical protein